MWQTILSDASALLLGAVGGGAVGALVTWRMLRSDTARRLLEAALSVQATTEAWILEGPDYRTARLSENRATPTGPSSDGLWLRRVEVRAVLDEAQWNSPQDAVYGFISGSKAWIVRDTIYEGLAYAGAQRGGWHPALLSSKGLEELSGWVEQVAMAKRGWMLSRRGITALKPLLAALCTGDRVAVLGQWLSPEARAFLERYREQQSY